MRGIARLQGNDIPFVKASYTQTQNQINAFTVDLPLSEVDFNNLFNQAIALYWQGGLVVSGFVSEMPQMQLDKSGRQIAHLECEDGISKLTMLPAKIQDGHYQDVAITAIVQDLLNYASLISGLNWQLTDISTMLDPAIKTTVDLRGKSTLFSQLVETVKSAERLFIRYNGYNDITNTYEIHIGAFGALTTKVFQHDNLISAPRMQRSSGKPVRIVEAIGGRSADEQVTLAEATIVPDPNYPIQIIAGRYVVNNLLVSQGGHIVEFFDVHKTKNEESGDFDTVQREQTANALYQRAIRYLQRSKPYQTIDFQTALPEMPLAGDKVFLRAKVKEPVYDQLTEQETLLETVNINAWYTITQVKMTFEEVKRYDHFLEDEVIYGVFDITATDNEYLGVNDDALEAYERLERFNGSDIITSPKATRGTVYVTVSHDEAIDLPDCGFPLGKSFTFNIPAIPSGSTVVYASVMAVTAGHTYVITQNPALPATAFILCVDEGTWGVAPLDVVSITVKFDFI